MTTTLMRPEGPVSPRSVNWIRLHGGVGDQLWVYKKLLNAGKPLFVDVASEGRSRPRRTGGLLDHIIGVEGWRYDDQPFGYDAGDWVPSVHEYCAFDKKWSEIEKPKDKPLTIECNKWLESGRRIEGWLPDLATSHHFPLRDPGPSTLDLDNDYVVAHVIGWPDVARHVWVKLINDIAKLYRVYLVGGSYDMRLKEVYSDLPPTRVGLLMDLSWPNLYWVLKKCTYCIGHASGLTILADLLKAKGVTYNPACLPHLMNTWNSPANPGMAHVNRVDALEEAVGALISPGSVWPPTQLLAKSPVPAGGNVAEVFSAAAKTKKPTHLLLSGAVEAYAATLDEALNTGVVPKVVAVIGKEVPPSVKHVAARTSATIQLIAYPDIKSVPKFAAFDLVAAECQPGASIDDLWGLTAAHGMLVVGGPGGLIAGQSLNARCGGKVKECSPGWWFVYRGV